MRAAIIGTGFMGQVHASAIRASGHELVGVVGTTPSKAGALAKKFPVAISSTSIDEILDLAPDVVHVCTPNSMHAAHATRALERGISTIVEKPIATTLAEAIVLAELGTSVPVSAVPFVYRYHPLVLEIRERISLHPTNRLWLLHGSYLQDWLAAESAVNWRTDSRAGGASRAFADIGVHWCDLMEFATGQRIVRLSARLGSVHQRPSADKNDTEDGGVIQFETDAGALGSLVVSQASAGRSNRLWFSFDGSDESYSFDQENPETAWIGTRGDNRIVRRDPVRQRGFASRAGALPAGHAQGYQACFNDFVGDVYAAAAGQSLSPVLPTVLDGLRAAELTEAVLASHRSNQWVLVGGA
jgi:predicted dehydrogenase